MLFSEELKCRNALPEGFKSLPEGSITQIFLHSRGGVVLNVIAQSEYQAIPNCRYIQFIHHHLWRAVLKRFMIPMQNASDFTITITYFLLLQKYR
jgi:hypothetical protein